MAIELRRVVGAMGRWFAGRACVRVGGVPRRLAAGLGWQGSADVRLARPPCSLLRHVSDPRQDHCLYCQRQLSLVHFLFCHNNNNNNFCFSHVVCRRWLHDWACIILQQSGLFPSCRAEEREEETNDGSMMMGGRGGMCAASHNPPGPAEAAHATSTSSFVVFLPPQENVETENKHLRCVTGYPW